MNSLEILKPFTLNGDFFLVKDYERLDGGSIALQCLVYTGELASEFKLNNSIFTYISQKRFDNEAKNVSKEYLANEVLRLAEITESNIAERVTSENEEFPFNAREANIFTSIRNLTRNK